MKIYLKVESTVVILVNDDAEIDEVADSLYMELNSDDGDLLESTIDNYEIIKEEED